MCDIVKEMGDHMPESLFRHDVLLAANVAVPAFNDRTAIQAIFLLSKWNVGQCKILLKNKYKMYKQAFFFVTEQFN